MNILFYTGGRLNPADSSFQTVIWYNFDEQVTKKKRMQYWTNSDPNRECVFARWNGEEVKYLLTDYCTTSATVLCMSVPSNFVLIH